MKDVVIVPAWRRPDFLTACLRRLLVADDGQQTYMVSLDRKFSPEVQQVTARFAGQMGIRAIVKYRTHRYPGNSFNVLTSYRDALTMGPELVHLVEEDIFVGSDYFDFHRQAHSTAPGVFAVSACRNQQFPTDPSPADDAVYVHGSYQSLGVSFRPELLEKIVPHAVPAYFMNPIGYCHRRWPHSRIPAGNAEQDGLIHRVIEAEQGVTGYPFSPRAYHAGFVGYHRKGLQLQGTLAERADRLLAMTSEDLNGAAHSFPDHVAVDLDARRGPVTRLAEWP